MAPGKSRGPHPFPDLLAGLGGSPPGTLTRRLPQDCTAYEEELPEDLLSDPKGDILGP